MSVIVRAAAILKQFKFDANAGWPECNGGPPCMGCLGNFHLDIRNLRCCVGNHVAKCVSCEKHKKKCAAIPHELYGAAQDTWLSFLHIRRYLLADNLDPLELWRCHRAIAQCSAKWTKLYELIRDPHAGAGARHHEAVQIQELASIREHLNISVLVQAQVLTDRDDILTRLDAVQPAYARNDGPAIALLEAIEAVDDEPWSKPAQGVENEGRMEVHDLPAYDEGTVQRIADCSANAVPKNVVAVAGGRPIGRGPETRTPRGQKRHQDVLAGGPEPKRPRTVVDNNDTDNDELAGDGGEGPSGADAGGDGAAGGGAAADDSSDDSPVEMMRRNRRKTANGRGGRGNRSRGRGRGRGRDRGQ